MSVVPLLASARPAPARTPPVLTIQGRTFLDAGKPWSWRMSTDFLLWKRHLDREDIGPVVEERLAAGANGFRVFGMCRNIVDFDPAKYADYFDMLPSFFEKVGGYGATGEFVLFADPQLVMPDEGQQRQYAARVRDRMRPYRSFWVEEVVNEWQNNQVADLGTFPQDHDFLSSHGSGTGDAEPAQPNWTHATYHPARGDEWPRKFKSSYDLEQQYGIPVPANEPIGADETDQPGKRSNNPADFYDGGACASLMSSGATFHSTDGVNSAPWRPVQKQCAEQFFAGMAAVPAEAHTWAYAKAIPNGIGMDEANTLRTYGMVNGNRQWIVAIRPGPGWQAAGINGWRVVQQYGDRGNVVYLER